MEVTDVFLRAFQYAQLPSMVPSEVRTSSKRPLRSRLGVVQLDGRRLGASYNSHARRLAERISYTLHVLFAISTTFANYVLFHYKKQARATLQQLSFSIYNEAGNELTTISIYLISNWCSHITHKWIENHSN